MLDLKGLPVLRRNLDAFIRADPILVALMRREKIKTAAGGYVWGNPVTLPAQQFRLTPFLRRLSEFTSETSSGDTQALRYVLVCRWNADIRRGDQFEYNGETYTVISIETKSEDRSHTDRVVAEIRVLVDDKDPPT